MAYKNKVPTAGEILASEFMEPLNISQYRLAKALGIPQTRISNIVNGKLGVSVDTDLRLCKYFGLTDGYFIGLDTDFERFIVEKKIKGELKRIIPLKIKK